jgi:hypothetical protein
VTPGLTTIVGNGIPGYSGDGGEASEPQLNRPKSIALDAAGNLYIADSENHCIRKVDPKYRYKFIKEKTEETHAGLSKTFLRDKTYTDTNADDISDLITETVAVNNKTTSLENNVLQSQKTVTTPEGRTVTTHYNPATLATEGVSIPGLFDTLL